MELNNWLTIDNLSGNGDAIITITASSSQEIEERIAALDVKTQTKSKTVTIKQKPNYDNKYFWVEFDDVGGAIEFPTKSYPYSGINIRMTYSFDGEVWTDFNIGNNSPTIEMGNHKKIYLYNKTRTLFVENYVWFGVYLFFLKKNCRIGGDVSALSEMRAGAFHRAFYKNERLTDASELILPWDVLENNCFESMFSGCKNLQYAPQLPSTVLAEYCYCDMFSECKSLTTAPILPAPILVEACYAVMFGGCSNLNYIEMYATDISADGCLDGWVGTHSSTDIGDAGGNVEIGVGVAPTGTFVKTYGINIPIDSPDGIPTGWTVHDVEIKNNDYLWVVFDESQGDIRGLKSRFSYSYDCINWSPCSISLTVPAQTFVYLKNDSKNLEYVSLWFTQKARIGGNLSSIGDMKEGGFAEIFSDSDSKLTDASELILPWNEVSKEAFEYMFWGCTYLKYGPQLPATVLGEKAYYAMFSGCTSLITAPSLPATTLGVGCYTYMFKECNTLTSLPTIAASDLFGEGSANSPAWLMFNACIGLEEITISSNLTKLASGMFAECSNLKTIYCYSQDAPSISYNTFQGVSTNGVLYTPQGSDYSSWLSTYEYYLGYYGWTGSPTL